RGYVYEARHKSEKAVELYREVLRANPNTPAFAERLSDLLIRLGRFQEAQQQLEVLAERAPRDARLWMKLGAVHYEGKQWDRAAEAFRRGDALGATNLRARYFLATAYT